MADTPRLPGERGGKQHVLLFFTPSVEVMADTPRYQVREVESSTHVPGRSTTYSSLLSPGFTQGVTADNKLARSSATIHTDLGTPNPDAHHSKRGGMPLTCSIKGHFINRRLVLSDGPISVTVTSLKRKVTVCTGIPRYRANL